ncbi:MAG: ABC transporter substrate binding protein [Proteobacteria bacterium]|nr:ABC transporter substrate binding protein [Pseudomonadota bacterium]
MIDAPEPHRHPVAMARNAPIRATLLGLRLSVTLIAMLMGVANVHAQDRPSDNEMPFVAVTTITSNAEIQAIIDGMRDELANRGRWPGDSITIEVADAGADTARAAEQIRAFVRRGATILVAISHPSIEAAVAANSRLPLVVAGVSLETAEGHKRDRRRRTVTGIVSGDTHNEQFELIRKLAPETKTVAVPIDPVDGSMQERLRSLTATARRHDLAIMPLPVSVLQNAVSNRISELAPESSVILLDRDLLPTAPVEALAAAAEYRKLPLFATDEDSVIRGALAAMVVEPFGVGVQLGNLIARILEDSATTRAPFERARASHLVVNQDARALVDVAALERDASFGQRSIVDWADFSGPRPRIKPSVPDQPAPLGVARGIKVPSPRARPETAPR